MEKICKCGCEKAIEIKNHHKREGMPTYIHGHNWRGKKQTIEHINKRQVWLGRHHTEETKRKISENRERAKNISLALKGKPISDATKLKISLAKKGKVTWNKGKTGIYNENTLKKMSEKKTGENSPFWLGGISLRPYDKDFNNRLKREVRKRDNYTCQECNYNEQQLGYPLSVHHIDYNKLNSKLQNLISLCRGCHSQTNFSREDWKNHFMKKNIGEAWSKL